MPFLLISGISEPVSNVRIGLAIFQYILGVVLMMTSDAQKYFTIKYKKGLINIGMFKYTRNPNYLGEILLYGAFGLLANHKVSWTVLFTIWGLFFTTNMILKD
jgi:steroid 5-alpha reductase family enzyme